jgi:hypothetical protein
MEASSGRKNRTSYRRFSVASIAVAFAVGACKGGRSHGAPSASSAALLASAEAWAAARASASAKRTSAPSPRSSASASEPSAPVPDPVGGSDRALDSTGALDSAGAGLDVEIGPAGPVVATSIGAVYRTKSDEVVVARLHRDARGGATIDPVSLDADAVPTIAPPPAFAGGHLYWVAHGKLVRRALAAGGHAATAEVLAEDAVDGSRVAAVVPDGPLSQAVAAYLARPASKDADRAARLWVEKRGLRDLSPEGSGASSVGLATVGSRMVAVTLDGRSAMTPVHARPIEIAADGEPHVGQDVVVTVGPPPEEHTEVVVAAAKIGPLALVALAKDERGFGLASIVIGADPHMDAPIRWTDYPNGIDPAPVAAARACGGTLVAYARPESAARDAATVLELGAIGADGGVASRGVLARERGVRHVTIAAVPGGALIVWANVTRAFARVLRC